jgi:protein ImuB
VGFTRFGTYALAISRRDVVVCTDAARESAMVERVPLACLEIEPVVRDRLLALGINTAGDFLALPAGSIRARFGSAAEALYRLAAGRRWAPLVPTAVEERHERAVDFDFPETNLERLLFIIKRLIDSLVPAIDRQGQTIAELVAHMTLDDRTSRVECIRAAAPTLDVAQLLSLIRLRLDALRLTAGVVTLRLMAQTCPASAQQHRLFNEQIRRRAAAADEAFARLRAECGDQSVVRARLRDAHLPSAQFAWEPLEHVPEVATPRVQAARPLVRRINATAVRLSPLRHVQRVSGPYVVSGGWWTSGVQRDYYFVHTAGGDLWWMYYDHRRQSMFLQGQVQ